MNFYEDFKQYESLWEDYKERRYEIFDFDDSVEDALSELDTIELEYPGFTADFYIDQYDPSDSYSYSQSTQTSEFLDFTYPAPAEEVFEKLLNWILPREGIKYSNNELVKEWKRLEAACRNYENENIEESETALGLFIVNNMEALVKLFSKELLEVFEEDAQIWASENCDPVDPRDFYDYD